MQDAAAVAQEKASELREQGSARLRDQFDQRSTAAGAQVRSLAEALRRSGHDLSNEGNSNAAQLTGGAADRIERVGSYLEQKSGGEVMRDVETFARRRPWMLAGIGMLAGMAAARFLKASSEQRYDFHRQTNAQWPNGAPAATERPGSYGQRGREPAVLARICWAPSSRLACAANRTRGQGSRAMATRDELRERPLGEVAKELTSDLSLLVRQEIELAKAEMAAKARTAAPGWGCSAAPASSALCAAGAVTAFLVLVFSLFLPTWLAALLVGVGLAAVAYVLVKQGRERIADAGKPVPEQTIETVKEDMEWAKIQASSARK